MSDNPIIQIEQSGVLEKYKTAGKVVSKVLNKILEQLEPGQLLVDICALGDKLIIEELNKYYKKITDKGISFPTCVSKNNIAGYFIPTEKNKNIKIDEGDLIKIELGAHIEGFPSCIGWSTIVHSDVKSLSKDDKRIKVMNALSEAHSEIPKMFKEGQSNKTVINKLERIAEKNGCNLLVTSTEFERVPGVYSFQVSKGIIDGNNDDGDEEVHKMVISRLSKSQDFDIRETEFEDGEIYAMDIAFSSGTGKIVESDYPCTVYRRNRNEFYSLKIKSSKETLKMIDQNTYPFPLSIKSNMGPRTQFGIKNLLSHDLIYPYPVMCEKENEFISRCKFTVLTKPKKAIIIANKKLIN